PRAVPGARRSGYYAFDEIFWGPAAHRLTLPEKQKSRARYRVRLFSIFVSKDAASLHLEGKRIALNERSHLIIAEGHTQSYAVASRRDADLIEQLSKIGIVFLCLLALIEE